MAVKLAAVTSRMSILCHTTSATPASPIATPAHCPGARRACSQREAMIGAFSHVVETAPRERQLALIRAHPDLATKASLTSDSTREQQGAGLASLGADEFARFTLLNDSYKAKFDFPFIFAVKGATKQQILASFEERLKNSLDGEFATAIAQVAMALAC